MESVGKIIAAHRKSKKMSQKELAIALKEYGFSLGNTAVAAWEQDINSPNAVQFLSVCKILGITDIYNTFIGYNPDDPLSRLNEEGRKKVLDYVELLEGSDKYIREEITVVPFIRELPLYDLPVSAGTGEFLDGESYRIIEVGAEVPKTATFGVRIKGDSMEPRFVNGQVVFIQPTPQIENGEIGIFSLNGDAYCKKLSSTRNGTFLVSLNEAYDPIPLHKDDSFVTFGRVVG